MGLYHRTYPPRGRVNFDGGLNNKYERSLILDNESPDCLNVSFENGAVASRQGYAKLNATAIGSFVGDGLYTRRTRTGGETMIAFAGGSAWTWDSTTFTTIGSAQSVFTAGVRVATTQYENHMFIGNGGVIPYKWNGTDFTRHGVYPPTTTATVATAATGQVLSAAGTYMYKVTFVNTQLVESDLGPAVTFNTASSHNALLTSIPVAPQSWGVSSRYIYRTVNGGSAYKRLATLSDNTTTTYEDGIADADLGAAAPTDNGVPPKYSTCAYLQNRLWVNDPDNPNLVWYSDSGEPYTFGSTNFVKIGDDAGDTVVGLWVYENSVVVGCKNSIHIIYLVDPDDETTWKPVRITSDYGTRSPFCFLQFDNSLVFAAMQNDKFVGFAAISGSAVEPQSTLLTVGAMGSFLKTERIEPEMFDVQEAYVGNISGIVFKNKAYITVTDGSGNTTNNRIHQADFSISNLTKKQKESWVPWSGFSAAQFTIYDGKLYFISSTAIGRVYQMEGGLYTDDNSAIDSYFWTKEFSGDVDEYNLTKDFRWANVLVEKLGAYYMDLIYRVDSDSAMGTTVQISLDPGGSIWGVIVWGEDPWGGGATQEDKKVYLATARGKRIQFRFSNQETANQRFKVHGMNFTYIVRGVR